MFGLGSCDFYGEYNEGARQNFEALWKLMDENYCFFEYKGVDWDEVYNEFEPFIHEDTSEDELFSILTQMLDYLKDGHVNLFSDDRFYTYEGWYRGVPGNFEEWLIYKYLPYFYWEDYEKIIYGLLADRQVGYIYYGTFTESILESDLDRIIQSFEGCKGVIVDIRDNGGGSVTNADRLASRFLDKKRLTGYIQHKQSKKRNDFSDPYPIYLHPSKGTKWLGKVVVLTNRKCYSAANNFASKIEVLDNVVLLGDTTGGGSGFPFNSELPNGWRVRFSTSPILNVDKKHTEHGVAPHIRVDQTSEDTGNSKDTLIEAAVEFLLTH